MPYRINAITGELDLVDLDNVPPTVATTYNADAGSATPAANIINFLGTAAQGISSSAAGSTVTYTIANASAVQKGVASFNVTNFTAAAGVITSNALTVTAGTGLSTGGAVNLGGSVTLNLTVPVIATNGGTGQTTYAAGDILYASAINTLAKLPAAIDGQVLTLAAGVPSWATPAGGTVTSVSGTAGRITSTGGATPVIDIDATYVGQASITTLGTITTGVWNGTAVGPTFGGTGQTTYATGDILYASAANTLSKLPASTDGFTLVLAGGVPTWAASPAAGVDSVTGTLNRITISGTASDPVVDIAATYVGQTSITTLGTVTSGTWNGTAIGATFGGTAQTSWATGDIMYASGVNTLSKLTATTNGFVLTLSAGVPVWASNPSGDVVGPGSATDTSIALFDGTTGKLIKGSIPTIDSNGNILTSASISGATLSMDVVNSSNTASSVARMSTTVAGSSAGDALYQASVSGGQAWTWGLDNSDSDAWVLAASSALGTTNVMRIAVTGEINYPLQPAFAAYLGTTAANVTGNGTNYFIGDTDTGVAMTEVFDQNGDFTTGGTTGAFFTAPVTCKMNISIGSIVQQASTATSMDFAIVASNLTWRGFNVDPSAVDVGGTLGFNMTATIDMDAADIVRSLVSMNGVGADTSDVYGAASDPRTYFTGFQVA